MQAEEVVLELVLLADAPGSIMQSEIECRRRACAEAIIRPEALAAIRTDLTGSIAVIHVEWAANQVVVVDWMVIDSEASTQAFAAALSGPPAAPRGATRWATRC
jgi:hypothetical protein